MFSSKRYETPIQKATSSKGGPPKQKHVRSKKRIETACVVMLWSWEDANWWHCKSTRLWIKLHTRKIIFFHLPFFGCFVNSVIEKTITWQSNFVWHCSFNTVHSWGFVGRRIFKWNSQTPTRTRWSSVMEICSRYSQNIPRRPSQGLLPLPFWSAI